MTKAIKIILAILLLLVIAAVVAWFGFFKPAPPPISPENRAQIELMPLPAELSLGGGQFVLDSDLGHQFSQVSTPRLDRAVQRFYKNLSAQTGVPFGQGNNARLTLECKAAAGQFPALADDESYSLKVSKDKIYLSAPSEKGIIYGLESLLQLARQAGGQWILPVVKIKDQPRYPWRGLMIDACRHWIPKEVILRNLDAMAAVKLNVLHWHLTEYQGFRVESKVFPKLHEMGSGGNFYTQNDIREVIEYAADRGIRVVPEFDLPGHSTSWFVGYPELASAPGPYSLDTTFGVLNPVMDPTREEVYQFLDKFFGEMATLFPDEYLHIGGDEVAARHWNESPAIQDFMKKNSLADAHALQAYFNKRLHKILEKHGKKMAGWDEIIHPDLPKEGIAVQSWRNQKSLWAAARNGNKAILSAGYYLDHKQPAAYHYNIEPTVIPGAVTIDIDSTNWKSWDCTMYLKELELKGSLYLFGEGTNLRGIMQVMDNSTGFAGAKVEGSSLTFNHESDYGKVNYNLQLSGDSLNGEMELALFKLVFKGKRSGGTDMTGGRPLPEFEKIEPLTPEQEANILGGEACMWSEMVDGITIESRIWPRAAAVAEKLWSPKVLTTDSPDMYRRLLVMDERLEGNGLMHRKNSEKLIREMAGEPYFEPLRALVSVLQEDRFFNRMLIYKPELYTTTPLNRVVDAARPESYVAYRFGQDVDAWLASKDEAAKEKLASQLEIWSTNHEKLAPAFDGSAVLKEVEYHSKNLSELAKLSLAALNGQAKLEEAEAIFKMAEQAHGGTVLPLVEPVRRLVEGAVK